MFRFLWNKIILLLKLNNMKDPNCKDCGKVKIQNCNPCDYETSSDCVVYKGDRLDFEPSTVKNGSARSLTSILEQIEIAVGCKRSAKIVTEDYTVIEEDLCKTLLLDGFSDGTEEVTYTITLPTTEPFYNETLVIKDISEAVDPSGYAIWEFNIGVQYSWNPVKSSTLFSDLAGFPHRVLILQYLKVGANYQWVPISPSVIEPEQKVIEDVSMLNGWETQTDSEVILWRQGKERKLSGYITAGAKNDSFYELEDIDRPATDQTFVVALDSTPWFGHCQVLASGQVVINLPDYASDPVDSNDSVFLAGINWFVD